MDDRDKCERILQIVFACVVILMLTGLAILDHNAEPVYYLMEAYDVYQLPMYTKEYQIKFYVKSVDEFNQKYPLRTPARANVEDEISTKYVKKVQDNCRYELQWYGGLPDFSTTFCDKFQSFGKYKEVGIHQVLQHPVFAAYLKRKYLEDDMHQVPQCPKENKIHQVLQCPDFPAFFNDS